LFSFLICFYCFWDFFVFFVFGWGFLFVVLSDFLGVFEALDYEDFGNLGVMFGV